MLPTRNMKVELANDEGSSHGHFLQGITTEVLKSRDGLVLSVVHPAVRYTCEGARLISQFLLLGSLSVSLNTAADLLVVLLAAAVTHKLKGNPNFIRRQRTSSGVGMIGLGTYVALRE